MPLAENAVCAPEISETVSQSAAALHSQIASPPYIGVISRSTAILRLAFPSQDENENNFKDHSGFQNESDSLTSLLVCTSKTLAHKYNEKLEVSQLTPFGKALCIFPVTMLLSYGVERGRKEPESALWGFLLILYSISRTSGNLV